LVGAGSTVQHLISRIAISLLLCRHALAKAAASLHKALTRRAD